MLLFTNKKLLLLSGKSICKKKKFKLLIKIKIFFNFKLGLDKISLKEQTTVITMVRL